jgi:hypothetical protein
MTPEQCLVRSRKNNRVIVEVPQERYKGMYLWDITRDGCYGICILSHADPGDMPDVLGGTMTGAPHGQKPASRTNRWDAIGIITLPEPK